MPQNNVLEELWVNIKADLTHMQQGLGRANKDVKSFVGKIGNASEELRSFGRNVTLVSGAVAGIGGLATKVFADFEQSMANVGSVTGQTGSELEKMSMLARQAGKETVFSASQAADAMFFLASAGLKAGEMAEVLNPTLNLAAAGNLQLAESTDLVVGQLKTFGAEASRAAEFADILAKVNQSANTDVRQLGAALGFAASQANVSGISFKDLNVVLGAMADLGVKGERAGTQVRQALARLINPPKEAADALSRYGITLEEIRTLLPTPIKLFERLHNANLEQADALEILGVRQGDVFNLIQNGIPRLHELSATLDNSLGAATKSANIQIDTLKGSFKLLMSVLQEAAIQVGEVLAPAVRFMADVVRDAVQIFNDFPKPIKQVVVVVGALASGLGLIVGPLSFILGMLPQIIAGFGTLKVALAAAAGPVGLITAGLAALAGGIAFFISRERRRREEMEKSISTTRQSIDSLIESRKNVKSLADEYIHLFDTQEDSNVESERQKQIIQDLNARYPGLISNEDTYAEKLRKVAELASGTNSELQRLTETRKNLERIKITLETTELRRQIREMEEDIGKADLGTPLLLGGGDGVKAVNDELQNALKTIEIFNSETREVARHFGTDLRVDSNELQAKLEMAAKSSEGMANITEDIANISTLIAEKQAELLALQVKQRDEQQKLTAEEGSRINELERQIEQLNSVESIYGKAIERVSKLKELQLQLNEAEQNRKSILQETVSLQTQAAAGAGPGAGGGSIGGKVSAMVQAKQAEAAEIEQIEIRHQEKLIEVKELGADTIKRIEDEVFEHGRQIDERRRRQAQITTDFIIGLGEQMGAALGNAALNLSDSWKESLKGLVDLIANTYKSLLLQTQVFAGGIFPPNIAALAKAAAAIAAITAAQSVAKGVIDSAAVGAEVKRSGVLQVHAGETVVPAAVVRGTRDQYREDLLGIQGNIEQLRERQSVFDQQRRSDGIIVDQLVLNNPMVDSPEFWDNIVENSLMEANRRRSKRIKTRG